jgi:6-phosphogluconolactonase
MNKTGLLCLAMIAPGLAIADGDHYVYTLLNQTSGNQVQTYVRLPDGRLEFKSQTFTGGLGNGAGLGSQGGLSLSSNGRYLTAVNAGNNTVSLFYLDEGKPVLTDVEPSGGNSPVSVTENDGLIYVVNQGTATAPGNIQGFARFRGGLVPIPEATASVSGVGVTPVEIKFTPDGRGVVVAEKLSNLIDTFKLDYRGLPVDAAIQVSDGAVPFGFDFDKKGRMFVTEASASTVSSYWLGKDLTLNTISKSVATFQGAACWDVVSPNGKYLYTGNAGTGNVSGFKIASDGSITLLNPSGVSGVTGPHTIDEAMGADGEYLYSLSNSTGGGEEITVFKVAGDGSLTKVETVGGLPAGTSGLVAR